MKRMMKIKTSRKTLAVGLAVLLLAVWLLQNPVGRVGYHGFGLTTYSAIPIPYFDLRIGPDGLPQIREKSHFLSYAEVDEYTESLSHDYNITLIIGTGYDGRLEVDEKILASNSTVIVLKTPEAVKKYNELRDQGEKVAAVLHSTC